ncbi:hypothetical protein SAMN02799624_04524 [Paenibacillus sp. UNC496MF]|uniref:hypothetical protein n=1 Tax=Paenibacillus sp. UNC496MF TaxID=1502753 RepID=UPI0008F359B0|nr:hypothetical protein [Paenibacillus sp. UNC496MF]SFJ43903.1 hypothetical protein SAMN02799624_04524 [Paenibacillus sp. UNC496MF]
MTQYEQKHTLIQKAIQNCQAGIELVALTEDNRFAGMHDGRLKSFVVSPFCNKAYTWSSSAGSILDRGSLENISEPFQFVDDVIGGQLELNF